MFLSERRDTECRCGRHTVFTNRSVVSPSSFLESLCKTSFWAEAIDNHCDDWILPAAEPENFSDTLNVALPSW